MTQDLIKRWTTRRRISSGFTRGANSLSYSLLLGLVGLLTIGAISQVGDRLSGAYVEVAEGLGAPAPITDPPADEATGDDPPAPALASPGASLTQTSIAQGVCTPVSVRNDGDATAGAFGTPSVAPPFTLTDASGSPCANNCTGALEPGQSCTVSVALNQAVNGTGTAVLSLPVADADSFTVSLDWVKTGLVPAAPGAGKWIFASETLYTASMGGLTAQTPGREEEDTLGVVDGLCQAEADSIGLQGTFRVWLSNDWGDVAGRHNPATQASSADYFSPIMTGTGGRFVASDWAALPTVDATNLSIPTGAPATGPLWSNTRADGTAFEGSDCSAFTDGNDTRTTSGPRADTGAIIQTTDNAHACADVARLICVQQ